MMDNNKRMMDNNKLLRLIDVALKEADNYVSKYFHGDEERMIDTKKTLFLLRSEVEKNPGNINKRVLRAMHDTGMASFKEYENSPLEDAINTVTELLYYSIPYYKDLQPLGSEFGKGDPI
jgi:hypothetical protein